MNGADEAVVSAASPACPAPRIAPVVEAAFRIVMRPPDQDRMLLVMLPRRDVLAIAHRPTASIDTVAANHHSIKV
jgi:hypothetical protein